MAGNCQPVSGIRQLIPGNSIGLGEKRDKVSGRKRPGQTAAGGRGWSATFRRETGRVSLLHSTTHPEAERLPAVPTPRVVRE